MYTLAYDEDALALVAVHGPGGRDDEDFPCVLTALEHLAADAGRRQLPGRFLIFAQEGAVAPAAAERRQIFQAVENLRSNLRFALVTRSGVLRAIMYNVGVAVPVHRDRAVACATFEEAAAWMARQTGQESTVLRRLLAAAETAALRMDVAAPR